MISTFKLNSDGMQKLIESYVNNANEIKNDNKGQSFSIPSFFQNNATGFLIYSIEKSLMVFADKESASEVMRIIDQHDTDEAMKRISELEIVNVP
ncbi:MAG: hypothetical protein ACOYOS_16845 [Syntrophales bacterium]